MIVPILGHETLDDLMAFDGRAELIAGRLVEIMGSGSRPGRIAFLISLSLERYAAATGSGQMVADGVNFGPPGLPPTGRQSFSPDAAFLVGGSHYSDDYIPLAPTFAAEVRSKNDHGPDADLEVAAKRAEYFAAGTLVVWDVNPVTAEISSYRSDAPDVPRVFRRGESADAEPALAGWTAAVDDLFARP